MIVKVGSPSESFHVHKSFLCNASSFFRAALEGRFSESADGVVNLPEDKPDTFDRFLAWLYLKEYDIGQLMKDRSNTGYWRGIIHDHVFADKIHVEAFQKFIIDQVVEAYQSRNLDTMSLKIVREIYATTPEASPLRRLAVAMYELIPQDWFQKEAVAKGLEKAPRFAAELIQKLVGSGQAERVRKNVVAADFYDQRNVTDEAKVVEEKKH